MADAGKAIGGTASGAATGAEIGGAIGTAVPVLAPVATAVGAVVGAVAGLIAGLVEYSPSDQERAAKKALVDIDQLEIPSVEKLKIKTEYLKQLGEFKPELQKDIVQQDTELAKIVVPAELKSAQMEALQKFSEAGREGLTAEDLTALNQMRNTVARDARGSNEAILQNRQMRGLGGAGDELAAQLMSQQGSAEKASAEGDRLAAMAQANRLAALSKSGAMATGMREQDVGEQQKVASAQDLINQFNTKSRQDVQHYNVNAKNLAQAGNMKEAQRIDDANVAARNASQQANADLLRENYTSQLNKITSRKNAAIDAANKENTARAADKAAFGGTMQGIGNIASKGSSGFLDMVQGFQQKNVYSEEDADTDVANAAVDVAKKAFGAFGVG
jgi:hypothetical protein